MAAAVAVALVAVAQAAAPARVTLAVTPHLFPRFRAGVADYVVRCSRRTPVALAFDAAGGAGVSVNGAPSRTGRFTARVPLSAGRALGFTVDRGPQAGSFHVRCLPSDFPTWTAARTGTTEAQWYVVGLTVPKTSTPGYAAIFDTQGVPVWWLREPHAGPMNATLMPGRTIAWFQYAGHPFGMDPAADFPEHGLRGRQRRVNRAVGAPTDHHEIQRLANGHTIVDSYLPRRHVNLTAYGKEPDARIVDGRMQELDASGRVVWSWTTRGHMSLSEAAPWWPRLRPVPMVSGRPAYDPFHLNSVDPHGDRIVISLRHVDAVYEIDRSTGAVVWKFGGTKTSKSLTVIGDPRWGSDPLAGQHDARLSDDGRYLTVFDNETKRGAPRALRYLVDPLTRTAIFVSQVQDPAVPLSDCCGSARILPNGHWVIDWGGSDTVVTEADEHGNRVFALTFPGHATYRAQPLLPGRLDRSALRRAMDAMAP